MASVSAPEAFSAKFSARRASATPNAEAPRAYRLRAPTGLPSALVEPVGRGALRLDVGQEHDLVHAEGLVLRDDLRVGRHPEDHDSDKAAGALFEGGPHGRDVRGREDAVPRQPLVAEARHPGPAPALGTHLPSSPPRMTVRPGLGAGRTAPYVPPRRTDALARSSCAD